MVKLKKCLIAVCMGIATSSLVFAAEDPVPIMQNYFNDLATGDFNHLGELFSENILWHQPGNGILSKNYVGKKAVFDLFGKFMEISKGTFRIDHVSFVTSNGSLATASLHFSASRKDQILSMDGVDLMRIEKGKIQEVWLFSEDQAAEDRFWSS